MDVQDFVNKDFPETNFRFDGAIVLPDKTMYLPVFPAKTESLEELSIKSSYPVNTTLKQKPDMIILDPPRDGIHPKALPKIIDYGVDRIVYISCKPTSLVRDLEVFLERGYRVEKAVAVDQFPWTANCETVVLLSKAK